MKADPNAALRSIPSVEALLQHSELSRTGLGRAALTRLIREVLDTVRAEIREGIRSEMKEDALLERIRREAALLSGAGPVRVLNATGVILHTNLGRAPLSAAAAAAAARVALGYSNLEFDLERGERGSRMSHVERLLAFLTGAGAGLAVNNNAAAVLLALNSLAEGRDVIVSRGELVEIGGSFRIPEVMTKSGARLREVGTTNKTHLKDYENAITKDTGLLLKVHASNYRIEGFTAEVSLEELAALGEKHEIPVMVDLGSGALLDVSSRGVPREPLVAECLAKGADLVTFSGDKLLGGPQAGLVVGKKALVRRLRENPLARAVRIDKLSLAALAATLSEFLDPDRAWAENPTLRMLAVDPGTLKERADRLAARIDAAAAGRVHTSVVAAETAVGGGALPLSGLETFAVALRPVSGSPGRLEKNLRGGDPPLIARIQNDTVLFDLRTLSSEEDDLVPDLVVRALEPSSPGN